jgi:hypothetical protein
MTKLDSSLDKDELAITETALKKSVFDTDDCLSKFRASTLLNILYSY